MDPNTLLIVANILISLIAECRRSRCTDIKLGPDGLELHRDIPPTDDATVPPVPHV